MFNKKIRYSQSSDYFNQKNTQLSWVFFYRYNKAICLFISHISIQKIWVARKTSDSATLSRLNEFDSANQIFSLL